MPIARSDITVPPTVDRPTAVLIVVVLIVTVAVVLAVLAAATGKATGITPRIRAAAAAVIDYLRPSPGVPTPTTPAARPAYSGAHRAANRTTRKRDNA